MKHVKLFEDFANEKDGLWANIHAKRKRGEKPAKPGEKGYPSQDALKAAQANEMASSDVHYKEIMALYHSGPFAKKKVGAAVCKNPNATQKQIEDELGDAGYSDMIEFIEALGIKEGVKEEKVYIDYLNKAKGFKQDRIKFNSYEEAVKWAKQNFEKFNPDMIKYESVYESHEDLQNYMFFSNLETIKRKCESILAMDFKAIDEMLNAGGHDWAADHITVAKENIDQVENFLVGQFEDDRKEIPAPSPEDTFEPEM